MKKTFSILLAFTVLITSCSEDDEKKPGKDKVSEGEVCGVSKLDLALEDGYSEEQTDDTNTQDIEFNERPDYETPTRQLPIKEWPVFGDDLDFKGMDLAIARQLERYNKLNLNGTINLGGKVHSLEKAKRSLIKFSELVGSYRACRSGQAKVICKNQLNLSLQQNFDLYMPLLAPGDPRYGEDKQTLFTAYYTPLLDGRTKKSKEYPHAIYLSPGADKAKTFDRVDIDFDGKLKNQELEIVYAKDLFDLYLLHVQGGGRVRLRDEGRDREPFYLSYAGANGKSFRFISKYMTEMKYIKEPTIYAQRKFLRDNPSKQREVYGSCPSYVYFSKSSKPPVGSDTVSLTDNRSIATDINHYRFKGLLSYVVARRPVQKNSDEKDSDGCAERTNYKEFSRFYLDQDTGGAIRGKARVDLYFGEGSYAEFAAYNTVQRGDLHFLMLKD